MDGVDMGEVAFAIVLATSCLVNLILQGKFNEPVHFNKSFGMLYFLMESEIVEKIKK
jgi:hypothetical protein